MKKTIPFSFRQHLFQDINERSAAFVYILKKMLPETEWNRFFHEFNVLVEAFDDVVKYEHMGFYEGWQDHIN